MSTSVDAALALVQGLVAAGVRDLVLCPGSRSAPVAYAAQAAERAGALRLHVRHDERTAAFVALGCGAADPSRPAVIVTTSGTAVANVHPAVMEAHHARVPLLVVTADRPHRLRGTWANQTSHLQAEVFGAAPVTTLDLKVPDGSADEWFHLGVQAVRRACGQLVQGTSTALTPGPVHLNLALDEPLVPDVLHRWTPGPLSPGPVVQGPLSPGPVVQGPLSPGPEALAVDPRPDGRARAVLDRGPRTVVVAGDRAGAAARCLAESAGWPVLAEPSSGSKGGPHRVGAYRLLLAREGFGDRVQRVVVFGHPTLSRPVTRLLDRADVELVQVVHHDDDLGPGRPARRVDPGVSVAGDPSVDAGWLASWVTTGAAAEGAVHLALDRWPAISGPLLAREVARATSPGDALVVAASNPVRDLDLVAPPADGALVLANRGLAGIDGTLSTAVGVAVASGRPTRLLVGDLAFLHDLGALAVPAAERPRIRLQVVVLDDDGGGIFGLLEHGEHPSSFERVFGTPHGVDLPALCAAHGVRVTPVSGTAVLPALLAVVPDGLSVVHVRSSRGSLRELHATLRAAVDAVVAVVG